MSALFVIAFLLLSSNLAAQTYDENDWISECGYRVPDPQDTKDQKPEYVLGNAYAPGKGFLVGRNKCGSMSISGYMLLRYVNQLPAEQNFKDHNEIKKPIDTRQDIQLHRVMVWLKGFIFDERLSYLINFWTVNTTNEVAIVGSLNYKFNKNFNLGAGVSGLPGTRSLNGQHPYFLGTERHMIDDFMRPGFTNGAWVNGEVVDKVNYRLMVGNNLSQVGISGRQLTRDMAYGGTIWWLPTTGEFGPREGFGDYEMHSEVATRFGMSFTKSREDRFAQPNVTVPDNTQIHLSDSTLFFETGAFGEGVTINRADYTLYSVDAAMKYKGFFFMAEYYHRRLDHFSAIGNPYQSNVVDRGLGLQGSFFIKPQKWETYLVTSNLWGEFNDSREFAIGNNYYPFHTRNFRMNAVVIFIDQSAMDSVFGYYAGGQTGTTLIVATDLLF